MKNLGKRSVTALAAVFGFLALSAQGCGSTGPQPKGVVLNIWGPPLAQTLGCPDDKWYISVLPNEVADDPNLTPDQKVAKAQRTCVDAATANRYVVNGQYP